MTVNATPHAEDRRHGRPAARRVTARRVTAQLAMVGIPLFMAMAAVCRVKRARPAAVGFGAALCVAVVSRLIQVLALYFTVSGGVEQYRTVIGVMVYINFGVAVAEVALLGVMAWMLRRDAGVSGAVFALPGLRALAAAVGSFGLAILTDIVGGEVNAVILGGAVLNCAVGVITAAFYAMIPFVLRWRRVSDEMPDETPDETPGETPGDAPVEASLRKEDFLSEI